MSVWSEDVCFACQQLFPKTYVQHIDDKNVNLQQKEKRGIPLKNEKYEVHFEMKLPFCYNCMTNEKIKSIRNKFEVPKISEDIFHKTEDSHDKSAKLLLPPSKVSKSKPRNTSAHLNKSDCCISQGARIGGIRLGCQIEWIGEKSAIFARKYRQRGR
ncbi:unnamed protein product [Moneuplotes crassus]|uniref:Uncharacterized protein n=1 Tax=Euplotes crassus TaxID=5936 RepID=A0AAD1UCR8_EUPCR|nr:unnamed protein product [Moneuplotes crassus]